MEGYEDDDDTHFCIKCHLTIHGLENYVRHRQSGCRPPDDKAARDSPSTPTTVSYPEILNADAFFSSLELRSSAKSNPRRTDALLESGRKFKKNERRKKGQKTQTDTEDSKEKLHGMLPADTDLEDPTEHLCIPSLVGFPDIVTSTANKSTTTVGTSKLNQSIRHTAMNIEGTSFPIKHEPDNSLEGLVNDSKQTDRKRPESENRRIEQEHQTWLDDTILADLVENNENKDLARYEFEYQQDVDSDDDMLDEDLAEDESYSESDDAEDRERPPRGHTGGKWKPDSDLPQDIPQLQEDEVEAEEDQHSEHPPPTYTGGKWRPTESSQKDEDYQSKNTAEQPPPGHTRGKWIPGAQTDIDSGYWCNPCGRKLASRLVYNRHLLSDLHARRSIREIDDGLHLPRNVDLARRISTRRQIAATEDKRASEDKEVKRNSRKREKEVLSCEMCHARVRKAQMGKHLLSHYHCRVAGINPRSPRARRFLLENMANVVRQCPFQCASCRFYCNTQETFLLHWRSALHSKTLEKISGSYRCGSCDFWCSDGDTMETHLLSTSHRDVVSMMNGSVPVVISRQRALPCSSCDRQFRYNLQLRLHVKETGHKESFTASDEYQRRITCSMCPQVVRSLVSLQRHQLACHVNKESQKNELAVSTQPTPYFCSFCSMNFATAREAVVHRRTSSHKEMVRAQKSFSDDGSKSATRDCPYCGKKQSTLAEHKEHLLNRHPDLCHKCPQCGILFALSQDVTRHTRDDECRKEKTSNESEATVVKEEWKCETCSFSTDSQAELIFHEALHAGSVQSSKEELDGSSASKPAVKYRCPLCEKAFAKVSLRNHIRSHTGERPFSCAKCYVTFARRSDLNAHQKSCSSVSMSGWPNEIHRRRSFVCSECNDAFYTKYALRQHMLRHAGKKYKCGLPGCPTVLRTASELKYHRSLVHDGASTNRRYPCAHCSYAGKTKTQLRRHQVRHEDSTSVEKLGYHSCPYSGCSFRTRLSFHLRRHVRLHTGTKPYKCRHCTYACNNLENLRKHVLSKTLHPGKTIYECDFCIAKGVEPFCTNFTKELRAHFLDSHGDKFPTPELARNYVLNMFDTASVSEATDQPN